MNDEFMGRLLPIIQEEGMEDIEEYGEPWEKITINVNEYLLLGDTFKKHFRLLKPVFEVLCVELAEQLVATGSIVRNTHSVPFRIKVLMVLWVMATPDSFRSVALTFNVHPGCVYRNYEKIIVALRELAPRYITWPNAQERNQMKTNFERVSGFPGIVGIMDGKHIDITALVEEKAAFRNRHHGFSILVQAVGDDRKAVRDLYAGEAGSLHDARVFRRSPLCRSILFDPGLFSGPDEHIIADPAYTLLERVMTPFRDNGHLTPLQRNYNRRLSRVRVGIEQIFGVISMVWRRIMHLHMRNAHNLVDHVVATFVLHNFQIAHDDPLPFVEGGEDEDENEDRIFHGNVNINGAQDDVVLDDLGDPHVPQGDAAALLEELHEGGEAKRWDLVNNLPFAMADLQ